MKPKPKDPRLQFRFALGVGDLITCILHSRVLGKLTKIITGKDKPCSACSKRAEALNILLPIPFWRLFFKTKEEMITAYTAALEGDGYVITNQSSDKSSVEAVKSGVVFDKKPKTNIIYEFPIMPNTPKDANLRNFLLISSSDNEFNDLIIRTQIYKRRE